MKDRGYKIKRKYCVIYMDTVIGPITGKFINNVVNELKKEHNKNKIIKGIIDPILQNISKRYYGHFITFTGILILMVIMLITLLVIIILNKNQTIKIMSNGTVV